MNKLAVLQRCLLFALAFFLSALNVSANDVWIDLKTEHFEVISNANEREIRELALRLEEFDDLVRSSFQNIPVRSPGLTRVIAARGDAPKYADPQFASMGDPAFLSIDLNAKDNSSFDSTLNRHAHFLLENNFGLRQTRAWVLEGLAAYFEASRSRGDGLAKFQTTIREKPVPGWDTMFTADHYSLRRQDQERVGIFRAQSLAFLMFWLTTTAGGTDETSIETLLRSVQSAAKFNDMLPKTVGPDSSAPDKFLRTFAESGNAALSARPAVRNVDDSGWTVSPVSEARRLTFFAEFHLTQKRPAEASTLLDKALAIEPQLPSAMSLKAVIKAGEFYYDEAEELARQAIALEPQNAELHYRLAVAMSKRGMTEYGFVSGYPSALAEAMRRSLTRAIELNPTFPEACALLAFVNFVRNEQIDESFALINRALQSAPENQRYLLGLAELNLRKENFSSARKAAFEVMRSAPSDALRLYAQNTVQRIDSTEYQLARIRDRKDRGEESRIVTDKPLSDEEIRLLRERATIDQIRLILKRPAQGETRIVGSLVRIDCAKERMEFSIKTATGITKLQSKSLDGVVLTSYVDEMSDFRLGCGNVNRQNLASVIFAAPGERMQQGRILSIEFVPKAFNF